MSAVELPKNPKIEPLERRFMSQIHGTSIVVPVFNSQDSLSKLVTRINSVMLRESMDFEIILVNDGSKDNSWRIICEIAENNHAVHGINLMRNFGQHNALLCGIRRANFDLIVTLDDDLQNPPEEITKMIAKLQEGYDVVYGTPIKEQHNLWRVIASWVTKLVLQNIMGSRVARQVSAYRVFKTKLREAFENYQSPYVSIDVLLSWGTNRFAAIPVAHEQRSIGKSRYTFKKLIIHALNMFTGFSVLPLQLASITGFFFTFFGICVLIFVVGRFFIEGSVPGFPFLASTVAIFSGAQLFALGIIGEYLARIHFRTMDKPPYVVRTIKKFTE